MNTITRDLDNRKELVYERSKTILFEHRILGNSATEIAFDHYEKPVSNKSIATVQIVIDYWHKYCTQKGCSHMKSYSAQCNQCIKEYLIRS